MKITFILNCSRYFIMHRLSLAEKALQHGYEVHVIAPINNPKDEITIRNSGCVFHPIYLQKKSLNPFKELYTFLSIFLLIRRIKPEIIHSLTIKAVIYSGLISKALKIPMITLIPGRGVAFTTSGLKGFVMEKVACFLYRVSLHRSFKIIFENEEDKKFFLDNKISFEGNSYRFMGSGVNVNKFNFLSYDLTKKIDERRCVLAARMLKDKGVKEFLEAAQKIKKMYPLVTFRLMGDVDTGNPNSYDRQELINLCVQYDVEYCGFIENMSEALEGVDIFCLPSYYAEGLPVSVLEASSKGIPVVTTDMPGCRDAIIHQETGLLVKPRSVEDLTEAILLLIKSPELCNKFSVNGRSRIENTFNEDLIHSAYLNLYSSYSNSYLST